MGRLIVIIMILFSITAFYSEANAAEYQVQAKQNPAKVAYQANDFYSLYYVYFNVIQALEVEQRLSEAAVRKVIFSTLDNLKQHRFSQLQINGYPGPEALRVTLRTDIIPNENKPILWLITNYSHQQEAVVTGEALKHAYGTYFYLIGDKLVKYQRLKQAKSQAQLATLPVNAQADYYLLDASPENDHTGKQLLLDALNEPASQDDRIIMNLTLSQYHLLDANLKGAEARIDKARDLLREMNRSQRRRLRGLFHHANQLVKLYGAYQAGHS